MRAARLAATAPRGSPSGHGTARLAFLALLTAFVSAVVVLTGCGPSYSVSHFPAPTPAASYVYVYSRVDYPLELQVDGASDTVTLQLSFEKNTLLVTPISGSGVTQISPVPFSLPTDLAPYQDISAQAEATAGGQDSPVLWQLVTPPLQSLLLPATPGVPRQYVSTVAFRWRVSAVHAGANLVRLSLAITYTLRSGAPEQGQIEVSSDPIPIRTVDAPALTILPNVRLEIVGAISLVGVGSILGFVWNIYSVIEKVIGALAAVRKLLGRLFHRRRHQQRGRSSPPPASRPIPPTLVAPRAGPTPVVPGRNPARIDARS